MRGKRSDVLRRRNSFDELSTSARQALNRDRVAISDEQIECGAKLMTRHIQFGESSHYEIASVTQ
jgi:hypothetical protein